MIDRRKFIAAAAAISAMPTSMLAAPKRLTVTTAHPPVFMWTKMIDEVWLPKVNQGLQAVGQDPIKFNTAYATIAKPGTELQTIEEGISDLGFVSSVFHPGDLPLQNISYVVPFGSDNIRTVVELGDRLNKSIPAMGAAFGEYNQTALTSAAVDAYHLFTNFPVNSLDDLKGRKIAAPGPAGNWLKGSGAVPVASNLNEYYNNIDLGIYDGAVVFTTAAAASKLYEVAPYVTLVNFGAMIVGALTVNNDVWDDLNEAEQAIFNSASDAWREAFIEGQTARVTGALNTIRKAEGTTVTALSEDQRIAWANGMPNIPADWADAMEKRGLPGRQVARGYVEGLLSAGAQLPRHWQI